MYSSSTVDSLNTSLSIPVHKEPNIAQLDGNVSIATDTDDDFLDDNENKSQNSTNYDTDDEVDSQPNHPIFYPIPDQNVQSGQPLLFDVKMAEEPQSPNLPLCLVMNCRSVYNKSRNLCELLSTIGPSLLILSETFERDKQPLQDLIKSKHYGTISCYKISHPVGGVL